MPLSVRNLDKNTTVFTKTMNGENVRIVWGAKGQHDDTQRVPNIMAEDIDFLNSLEHGIFEVVDGPEEILKSIDVETSKTRELREASLARAAAKTEGAMDRQQDNSMIGDTCIGPGVREGMKCDRQVLIAHSMLGQVPPLCQQHSDLAPTFSLLESGSKGEGATQTRDGVVRREWRQATMVASRPGI